MTHRCGTIALVGRPNVGKSSLLNALLGEHLAITARRPQTTRHRLLGVKTLPEAQLLYLDTPGLQDRTPRALNRRLNQVARATLADADVVVLVIEALHWTEADRAILQAIRQANRRLLLVVNKIDRVRDKKRLLPYLAELSRSAPEHGPLLVSATRREGLEALERAIVAALPEAPPAYPPDTLTDRPLRFLVAERVREQLVRQLGDELPYASTVSIEQYREGERLVQIAAVIWVERESQKPIVIGREGARLKAIGTAARRHIQDLLGTKVMLELWVRVRADWSDDPRALDQLGYEPT